jgi:hypothetical protein
MLLVVFMEYFHGKKSQIMEILQFMESTPNRINTLTLAIGLHYGLRSLVILITWQTATVLSKK